MKKYFTFLLLIIPQLVFSQQVADTLWDPPVKSPMYARGKGPLILIDEGHNNFHTRDGRFSPFARLLEKDGYVVGKYSGIFTKNDLRRCRILVISNAVNKLNAGNWYKPVASAFTTAEIDAVAEWVNDGGSLFLIADHMPFGGAAAELASRFGFEFSNGFVMDTVNRSNGIIYFGRSDGTLPENAVTNGRNRSEAVGQIATFTGQGFRIPSDATPLLVFGNGFVNLLPDTAWVFNKKTPRSNPKGYSQGAIKKFGKGRVAAFGEAAMFSAQIANGTKMGMNSERAPENYRLLLNVIHWLDKKL